MIPYETELLKRKREKEKENNKHITKKGGILTQGRQAPKR